MDFDRLSWLCACVTSHGDQGDGHALEAGDQKVWPHNMGITLIKYEPGFYREESGWWLNLSFSKTMWSLSWSWNTAYPHINTGGCVGIRANCLHVFLWPRRLMSVSIMMKMLQEYVILHSLLHAIQSAGVCLLRLLLYCSRSLFWRECLGRFRRRRVSSTDGLRLQPCCL